MQQERKDENSYIILIGKSEAKRPLGRYILKREDNIIIDFKETGLVETVDWNKIAQDRD
jgi:hypothetical protein